MLSSDQVQLCLPSNPHPRTASVILCSVGTILFSVPPRFPADLRARHVPVMQMHAIAASQVLKFSLGMDVLSVGLGLLGGFSRPAVHHRADRLSGSLRTSFSGHVPSAPCPRPIYIIARTYSQPVRIPRHTYVTDHITTSHFSSMRTSSSSSLCLLLPGCEWASIFDLLIVTRILHGNNQHCTRARLLFSSVVHQGPCSS